MADEGGAETFEYTLGGRVMTFKKIHHGQVVMLERYWESMNAKADIARDGGNLDEAVRLLKKASGAFWRIVESQFLSQDDLEFAQEEILLGRLTEADLGPIISNGETRTVPPQDDADPAPAKRAGRKAPAKKAAKKASPRAAKR